MSRRQADRGAYSSAGDSSSDADSSADDYASERTHRQRTPSRSRSRAEYTPGRSGSQRSRRPDWLWIGKSRHRADGTPHHSAGAEPHHSAGAESHELQPTSRRASIASRWSGSTRRASTPTLAPGERRISDEEAQPEAHHGGPLSSSDEEAALHTRHSPQHHSQGMHEHGGGGNRKGSAALSDLSDNASERTLVQKPINRTRDLMIIGFWSFAITPDPACPRITRRISVNSIPTGLACRHARFFGSLLSLNSSLRFLGTPTNVPRRQSYRQAYSSAGESSDSDSSANGYASVRTHRRQNRVRTRARAEYTPGRSSSLHRRASSLDIGDHHHRTDGTPHHPADPTSYELQPLQRSVSTASGWSGSTRRASTLMLAPSDEEAQHEAHGAGPFSSSDEEAALRQHYSSQHHSQGAHHHGGGVGNRGSAARNDLSDNASERTLIGRPKGYKRNVMFIAFWVFTLIGMITVVALFTTHVI
ncbi:hypothetical protein JCM10908_005156 [Rhodotorula pacifica]|uniref:uncharacterized protein n=1 Tax=Rhodotorula pacifica TaxID=1495444 RepID=UPI00316F2CDF